MAKREVSRKGKDLTPKAVLTKDWGTFTKALPRMNQQELQAVLDYELAHENRPSYVFRIHRKFNQVRYANEKEELGVAGTTE